MHSAESANRNRRFGNDGFYCDDYVRKQCQRLR